jgi:rRNA-processing protein FCF1
MPKEEFDIFNNNKVYPNADKIFITQLPNVQMVKDDCIFVLDTNALLVPYSTGSDSLVEISKIFAELKKNNRLKIPDQVAREFADNRPKKISEMFNALSSKRNGINDFKVGSYPLLEALPEYNEILELENQLNELSKKYRKSIGKVVDTIRNWSWDDPVSVIYRKLFTPEVIHVLNFDQEKVEKDLRYRYLHKMPPGYKDEGKEDSGIGDFLIWLSILDIGKGKKNVVFVSGDFKSDWYHKSSKEALYPRFELLSEFNQISENHSFHMIRLSELLKLMGAKDEVVSEVIKEESVEIIRTPSPPHILAEVAVYHYYQRQWGAVSLHPDSAINDFDLTYFDGDGIEYAVEVISLRESTSASKFIIQDRVRRIQDRLKPSNIFKLEFVLVAQRSDFPFSQLDIDKLITNMQFGGLQVVVYTGFLDAGHSFHLSSQDEF